MQLPERLRRFIDLENKYSESNFFIRVLALYLIICWRGRLSATNANKAF